MFDFLFMTNNYESRCVGRWDSADERSMVSTAEVNDGSKPYETAFQHPEYNGGKMVIVEAYDTKEAASEGHARWVKVMVDGPLPAELTDCCNSGISQFADALADEADWRVFKRAKQS